MNQDLDPLSRRRRTFVHMMPLWEWPKSASVRWVGMDTYGEGNSNLSVDYRRYGTMSYRECQQLWLIEIRIGKYFKRVLFPAILRSLEGYVCPSLQRNFQLIIFSLREMRTRWSHGPSSKRCSNCMCKNHRNPLISLVRSVLNSYNFCC